MGLRTLPSTDAALGWLAERGARGLCVDSRRLQPGDAFIAWPGHAVDARAFVPQALADGACACLVEADGAHAYALPRDGRVAALAGLKAATGEIASAFMGRPSERLHVVACTGTNGKTSTCWWTAEALAAVGTRCGVVGTLGIGEPPTSRPSVGEPPAGQPAWGELPTAGSAGAEPPASPLRHTGLTTPDPVTLQHALRSFADDGVGACAIEASSIGIEEARLAGTRIAVAQFTNFTQDHLDYHGSMATYWQAKARLFAWPGLRAAVINVDDERGAALAASMQGGAVDVRTYSTQRAARLHAADIAHDDAGLRFVVHEGDASAEVATRLIGGFNAANLLAVIGALRALGIGLEDAARACTGLTPVPGRMQRIGTRLHEPQVVVDYAHTPDALEKALLALLPFARERGGKLWCVFGCGGNRDAAKRPLMGAVATRLARRVVVTSDNPRLEPPAQIVAQIVAGTSTLPDVIPDRAEAIDRAVHQALARDVILIAGKGHEDYQDAGGVKRPFSDAAEAAAALRRRRGESA